MDPPSNDDLAEAVRKVRDRDFAHLTAFALTLAADTAPDIIRAALRRVFEMPDMGAIERKVTDLESQAEQALFSLREVELERRKMDTAFRDEHQCRIGVLEEVRELREQVKEMGETQEKIRLFLIQRFGLGQPVANGVHPKPADPARPPGSPSRMT